MGACSLSLILVPYGETLGEGGERVHSRQEFIAGVVWGQFAFSAVQT